MTNCRHGLSEDCPTCMQATIDALVKAMQDLTNEVEGCWRAFDPAIRAAISNTNYAVVQDKLDKAKRVLDRAGSVGERGK